MKFMRTWMVVVLVVMLGVLGGCDAVKRGLAEYLGPTQQIQFDENGQPILDPDTGEPKVEHGPSQAQKDLAAVGSAAWYFFGPGGLAALGVGSVGAELARRVLKNRTISVQDLSEGLRATADAIDTLKDTNPDAASQVVHQVKSQTSASAKVAIDHVRGRSVHPDLKKAGVKR